MEEWADDLAEVAQAFCDLCDDSRHDRPDERKTSKLQQVILLSVAIH